MRSFLTQSVGGMPLWGLIAIVLAIVLDRLIRRSRWTAAQGLIPGVARFLRALPVVGKFPIVGQLLDFLSEPDEPAVPAPKLAATIAPPSRPPSTSGRVFLPILVMLAGVVAIGVLAFGCGDPMTTFYKSLTSAALATTGGYKSLAVVDKSKLAAIRAEATAGHPDQAQADLAKWEATYAKARVGLDAASSTVEEAFRRAPDVEAAVDKPKAVGPWLALLAKVGIDVVSIIASVGK